jgi:galactokinase
VVVERAGERFREVFGTTPAGIVFAPGRVNLVGEHTDYNDGFVLPMAVERGIALAFGPRDDDLLRVHSADVAQTRDVPLSELARDSAAEGDNRGQRGGWVAYVAGVAWAMLGAGLPVRGTSIALTADLPIGAGLSSSAALEIGVARALAAISGWEWEPKTAALLGQRAEREFAGVACGIMDQLAVAAARENSALFIDCRTLDTRDVPLPAGIAIVIFDSGVKRGLASSAYNERRASCERVVEALRVRHPEVTALRDADMPMLEAARAAVDATDYLRARHVIEENPRPAAMSAAFAARDMEAAGRAMRDSHVSLRDLYAVSTPELDALVDAASAQAGCYGARLTGAGFGGCVVAMADASAVESLKASVAEQYRARCGRETYAIVSRASAGARLVA